MFKFLIIFFLFVISINAKFFSDVGRDYNYYTYSEPKVIKIKGDLHSLFTRLGYLRDGYILESNYSIFFASNAKYFVNEGQSLVNISLRDNFWDVNFKFGIEV